MKKFLKKSAAVLSTVLVLGTAPALASTVILSTTNWTGTAASGWERVTWTGPSIYGSNVVVSPVSQMYYPVNGQPPTATLLPGLYSLQVQNVPFSSPVLFAVPNDTNTYYLSQLVTNLTTTSGAIGPPFVTSITGTNGLAVTPSDGKGDVTLDPAAVTNGLYNAGIDWGNGVLDSSFLPSVDWNNRVLEDSFTHTSINWQSRTMWDGASLGGHESLDYANRDLMNGAGATVLEWNNANGVAVDTNLTVSQTFFATLAAITNAYSPPNIWNRSKYAIEYFGLHADGQIANGCYMTNGNATLVVTGGHFVPSDVGKVIMVYQAQTNYMSLTSTILAVNNSTNVTLADVAGANCADTACVYGHDDTMAIQNGINLALASSAYLSFPTGICIVNGPIIDPGSNTNHYNAQLHLPDIPPQDGQTSPALLLEGTFPPQTQDPHSPIAHIAASGTVIWSTLPNHNGGSLLSCQNLTSSVITAGGCDPTDIVPVNAVRLGLKNLTFRMPSNPNGTALYLRAAEGCDLNNLLVDSGYALSYAPEPTFTNSYGIYLPAGFINGPANFDNVAVVGFYNGLGIGEHGNSTHTYVFSCWNALDLSHSNGHETSIAKLDVEECKWLYAGGTCQGGIHVGFLTMENYASVGPQAGWNMPWGFFTGPNPWLIGGDTLFQTFPDTNAAQMMPASFGMEVRQQHWNGSAATPPEWLTPIGWRAGATADSLTLTGANYAMTIQSPAQGLLWRNGNNGFAGWLDASGMFHFNSTTNAFANVQQYWAFNPVTGAFDDYGSAAFGGAGQLTIDNTGNLNTSGYVNGHISENYLWASQWDYYGPTFTPLTRAAQSPAPYYFSDGVSCSGSTGSTWTHLQVPEWATNAIFSGYFQCTTTQAWTNSLTPVYASLNSAVGGVSGTTINFAVYGTNGLVPWSATVTWPVTNCPHYVQLIMNPSTNSATRYLIAPIKIICQ